MTQINWQLQPSNRAGGYIVTNTDWNDIAADLRALIDQTTSSASDNTPLPIGIDLVNDRVYISDPDSTTPEDGNHADTTLSVVGTTTLNGNTQQTGTLNVGVDDTGFDVKFYGATTGKSWLWDESGDTMFVTGGTLLYGDLTVGVDDTGYDVQFFGATASAYMKWDQANDDLVLAGAAGLDIEGDVDVDGTTNLDVVDIDGAVDIANTLTITGAYDFTIGDSGAQILGPASGSAAAPSYGFFNDSGLGIYRSDTDVMHVATANVARQTWLASGAVLINATATFDNVSYLYFQVLGGIATKIAGTALTSQMSFFNDNGRVGWIGTSGIATSYNESSDYRLKENVAALADAVDRLDNLNPIRFSVIGGDADETFDGFLAHEVAEVVPQAISGDKDAVDDDGGIVAQGIDHSKLVPLLTAAVQELSARIAALEAA